MGSDGSANEVNRRSTPVFAGCVPVVSVPATAQNLQQRLYLPNLPDVDVLVRTSGEMRISNFLLWQITGSVVYFSDKSWPEFDEHEIDAALALLPAR